MREIKFRVWWEKQMRHNAICGNGQVLFIPNATGEYKWINQAECSVMQYTGLKDKNGKEIYEGDVLQHSVDKMFLKWLVEFNVFRFEIVNIAKDGDLFQRFPVDGIYYFTDREIIGNIYENPIPSI